jgi:hypothetical protein
MNNLPQGTVFSIIQSVVQWLIFIVFTIGLIGIIFGIVRLFILKKKEGNKKIFIYSGIALVFSIILFIIIKATTCSMCADIQI